MNRYVLVYLIAIVLLTAASCRPHHPPHTPQPFGVKDTNGGLVSANGHGNASDESSSAHPL